jgi:uncharacterized protein YbaA (DUF1428 family)
MKGYIDLYLLPVPKKNIDAYRQQATAFGQIVLECGGLGYREFVGEDLSPKGVKSFKSSVTIGRGEVLTTAVAEFKSRQHRDRVMKKVMNDPRIKQMMVEAKPLANMKQMRYGGFETFVSA